MARIEVPVQMGEVPIISSVDELHAAAEVLATGNAAYVVSDSIDSVYGPVVSHERKVAALLYGLNLAKKEWTAHDTTTHTMDAASDIGMHGNTYQPGWLASGDCLHYHRTPRTDGQVRVTFARATEAYMAAPATDSDRLTQLLAEGKTDPRYADPESFQRVVLGAGGVVVFRLNEGPAGLPLLHSFETIGGGSRDAEITPLYRSDPGGNESASADTSHESYTGVTVISSVVII